MSDSSGKPNKPNAQAESGKKHGDKLVPDLPSKEVGDKDADRVKGGAWDVAANKKV